MTVGEMIQGDSVPQIDLISEESSASSYQTGPQISGIAANLLTHSGFDETLFGTRVIFFQESQNTLPACEILRPTLPYSLRAVVAATKRRTSTVVSVKMTTAVQFESTTSKMIAAVCSHCGHSLRPRTEDGCKEFLCAASHLACRITHVTQATSHTFPLDMRCLAATADVVT